MTGRLNKIAAVMPIILMLSSVSWATGLVAAYTFEGGNANDVSGVSPVLNGTLLSGATIIADPLNPSNSVLNPNGGGVRLGLNDKLRFGGKDKITIQYWQYKNNPDEQWRYMVGQGGSGPRCFNQNGGMIFEPGTYDSGWNPISVWRPGYPNPQVWHHIVQTYDGNEIIGYIDGVEAGRRTRGAPFTNQDNFWSIGRQYNGNNTSGSWDSGPATTDYIDDVAIWDDYAAPEAVLGLYNGTYTLWNAPIGGTGTADPKKAILKAPWNGGKESNGWYLAWDQGSEWGFTHDVYLGTDYNAVLNAERVLEGDITNDRIVDADDLLELALQWLDTGGSVDLDGSGTVDLGDLYLFAKNYLVESPYQGNQTATRFHHSGLEVGQTYYWRIDEFKDGQVQGKSDVWSFTVVPRWQQTQFLISIGWTDAHGNSSYLDRLKDMGMTTLMDSESSLAGCAARGMNVAIYRNPTHQWFAKTYKDNPGTWGYFQMDEPTQSAIPFWAEYHLQCHAADPGKPSYTNIQSINYGVSRAYVDYFCDTINPEILSFDYYQWKWPTYTLIENLEYFRSKAISLGIPLHSWIEARPTTTSSSNPVRRRWSTYTNLVYGVKGIWWFTRSDILDNSGNIITGRTNDYNDIKAINSELKNLGSYLVNLTSTSVYHASKTGGYRDWAGSQNPMLEIPGDFWVQIPPQAVTLGSFSGLPGYAYMMVTNRTITTTLNPVLSFKEEIVSVEIFDAVNNTWLPLTIGGSHPNQNVTVSLVAGDGKLIRVIKQ